MICTLWTQEIRFTGRHSSLVIFRNSLTVGRPYEVLYNDGALLHWKKHLYSWVLGWIGTRVRRRVTTIYERFIRLKTEHKKVFMIKKIPLPSLSIVVIFIITHMMQYCKQRWSHNIFIYLYRYLVKILLNKK